MPTSHLHQLNEIVELIDLTNPQTLLDVGVGFGKYGLLAREFLELRDGRSVYNDWQRRIEGIEVFAGYLTPLHEFVYDHIHVGNALDILPQLPVTYDLILLIDVLEHFTKEQGRAVFELGLQKGRNVIVSTPNLFFRQHGFGNPYEAHLSHWTPQDFAPYAPKIFIPNDISLIGYFGRNTAMIQQTLNSPRRRVKRLFPWIGVPYRALKKTVSFLTPGRNP